ncbi:hypothetical protein DAPPUDRAFT_240704 [Daphnia pulex]|uniref:Uncharacterized protein n=1 Tax=Daphnia pulex TaxID=6669 RepID=E9GCA9_DAPPU|nr:hypothetical protein DAPPUDRAFT_240704 [Daphnia pulex]|eukprot:EFX82518.1 hypothetical protein DAPPUDRAFT_240704 [Daphnia pulex]
MSIKISFSFPPLPGRCLVGRQSALLPNTYSLTILSAPPWLPWSLHLDVPIQPHSTIVMSLCIFLAILVSAAEAAPPQKRQYCGNQYGGYKQLLWLLTLTVDAVVTDEDTTWDTAITMTVLKKSILVKSTP